MNGFPYSVVASGLHVDHPLDGLLDDPLANHLVMVSGHHRRRLERWWRLAFAT